MAFVLTTQQTARSASVRSAGKGNIATYQMVVSYNTVRNDSVVGWSEVVEAIVRKGADFGSA